MRKLWRRRKLGTPSIMTGSVACESEPLRIAFISPFLFRLARGIERFTANLASQLVTLGQNVTIISWNGLRNVTEIDNRVRIVRVPTFRYFEARTVVPFYVADIWRNRYDIMNIFFAGYGEARSLQHARHLGCRFAANFIADYPFDQAPHQYREFIRTGFTEELDAVIVRNKSMSHVGPLLKVSTRMLPPGVNEELFDPSRVDASKLREQLYLRSDECVLLTVAALEKRKGMLSVIDALPLLLRMGTRLRYLIVGEGPDRGIIQKRIIALGLDEYVHLVGEQADVRPFYKLADIFLLLSSGEAFPNAFLEALAMELPAIVSHHSPYDEIASEEFAVQVDEKNAAEVAKAIEALMKNPARRHSMGQAARARAHATYAWPMVARRYLDMFREQATYDI